ncbi:MAG: 4Fe-4S binding protein [Planctomycetota bacterium]
MRINVWRRLTQFSFALIFNPYYLFSFRNVCAPVLNCWGCPIAAFSCPIGALGQFFANGVFPFLVLGILFFFGAILGRLVCGWACPFGFLQDLLYKIPSYKINLPLFLKYGKYVILIIMVICIPLFFGITTTPGKTTIQSFFFCNFCPAGTLEATLPAALIPPSDTPITTTSDASVQEDSLEETNTLTTTNTTTAINNTQLSASLAAPSDENILLGLLKSTRIWIFIIFLVAFVLISRPFCRSVCPLGAIFAILNKVSIYKIRVDKTKCIECRGCNHCGLHCPDFAICFIKTGNSKIK